MFKEQEKGNYPLRGGDKIEMEELYGWKEKRVWKEIKVDRRKGKCIDGQRIVWNENEVYGRKEKCMKGKEVY